MNGITLKIMNLQEVKKSSEIVCPYCQMTNVKIKNERWKCSCGKNSTILELLLLCEEEYLSGKPQYFWDCISNKGVGY